MDAARFKYEISKTHFMLLGIVSLTTYNFFLQRLGSFTAIFGERYAAHSHIAYGLFATIGQVLCISTHQAVRPHLLIHMSLFMIALISFVIVAVVFVRALHLSMHGLLIAAGMGLFISILQSASSAFAADLDSSDLLNAFYLGQSLSGVFPWPISSSLYPVFSFIPESNRNNLITATSMIIGGLATLVFASYMLYRGLSTPSPKRNNRNQSTTIRSAFVSEWPIIILCWFTFAVSFTVYPRDLFKWFPLHNVNTDMYRSTLVYVAIIADIGGMFAGPHIPLGRKLTHILGYARVLFIPIFALISSSIFPIPELVHIITIVTMSFSGGLILSSAMSQILSDSETVGHLVSISLTIGIMAGSCIGSVIDMFL